jgi:hypothetical protein
MNFNPNINDKGPSQESWYKDGLDMGRRLGTQPKKENDNIKEFQDLFRLGTEKIDKKANYNEHRGKMDITYNPAPLSTKPAQDVPRFGSEQPSTNPFSQPVFQPVS